MKSCFRKSDLVVLVAAGAPLRVQTVRFSGSRSRGPAQSMTFATWPPSVARLRIQEALIGFRTVARNADDGACARVQLRLPRASRHVRRGYNSSRLSGFRTGSGRSWNRSSGRAWHGATREICPHLPEVPKNLDCSSICKMGAIRKTGKEAPPGNADG